MPTFSFAGLPFDVLVALGLLALLIVVNYTIGKHRPASLLVALYVAGGVTALSPVVGFLDAVVPVNPAYVPAAVFAAMTCIVFLMLRMNRFFEPYIVPSGWELGLFAVLQSLLAVSIAVQLLPVYVVDGLSPNFLRVFGDGTLRSVYIVAPIVVLCVFRGRD